MVVVEVAHAHVVAFDPAEQESFRHERAVRRTPGERHIDRRELLGMVPKGGAHGLRQRHVTNLAALRQREHVLTADALELVTYGQPTTLVVEFVF